MKKLLVIQEHNAKRAGLHWDVRFESDGSLDDYLEKREPTSSEPIQTSTRKVLRSFVIPKHQFPAVPGKVLLAIRTEDHPWEYKDFEGTIESGYGAGEVKLLFNNYVEVTAFSEDKITFEFTDGWTYTIFKAEKNYFIKRNS